LADHLHAHSHDLAPLFAVYHPNTENAWDRQAPFVAWRSDLYRDVEVLKDWFGHGRILTEVGFRIVRFRLSRTVANVDSFVLAQFVIPGPGEANATHGRLLAMNFGRAAVEHQPDILFMHGTGRGTDLSNFRALLGCMENQGWMCQAVSVTRHCVVLLKAPHAEVKGNIVLPDLTSEGYIGVARGGAHRPGPAEEGCRLHELLIKRWEGDLVAVRQGARSVRTPFSEAFRNHRQDHKTRDVRRRLV